MRFPCTRAHIIVTPFNRAGRHGNPLARLGHLTFIVCCAVPWRADPAMKIPPEHIQGAIAGAGLDGWLLCDFHGSNPIAGELVGVSGLVTRRWCCWVPRHGRLQMVCHTMERTPFSHLDTEYRYYLSWRELDAAMRSALGDARRIAMEYSPGNAIPNVAHVDAGTVEKIRSWGIEVVSSADLVAHFLARWTPEQIDGHRTAAAALLDIKNQTFVWIGECLRKGKSISEYDVAGFVRDQFAARGLMTDAGPICAVDGHAGSPHYEPAATGSTRLGPEQLVLLDLWAKWSTPDAVYADITWTGFTGSVVPRPMAEVFDIVRRARDSAVEYANVRLAAGAALHACEIDDACRRVIADAGYGDRFIHRTGHSIGTSVHGVGPNIDNLETQDQRLLENGMCFSVEPGIYLPEFGIRSEIDVLIENDRAVVTTLPLQTEIVPLLP